MIFLHSGLIAGLLSAFFAGSTGLLVRGMGARIPPIGLNAWRCTLAALIFIPAWFFFARSGVPQLSELLWIALSVVLSIVVGDTLFFFAINKIGVAKAIPICKSYPIFTVVFAFIFLGEPLKGLKLLGVVFAIIGTTLMSRPPPDLSKEHSPTHWSGIAFALTTAVAWALGVIVVRVSVSSTDIMTVNMLRMSIGSVLLWLVAASIGQTPTKAQIASKKTMVFIVLCGLCLTMATLLLVYSISTVGAGTAAVYGSMAPLFAVPLGMLIFKEKMHAITGAGCLCSLIGIALVALAQG